MIEQDKPEIELDFDDPRVIEEQNNRKLTADKIRQILSKVENNPADSSKRWVWELIQNAKDVPNTAFGRVSIQMILTRDKLIFKHNGDPFSLKNIFSLIQQVSSKDSTNSDEEVTGKFGTGFITTHLLSKIIEVDGRVKHRGVYRRFKTILDRSGNNSEEMLPKITSALDHIRNIENDEIFPKVENYETNRKETSLDTSFTYHLNSDESLSFAIAGIKDLINTLPVTLVYLPKIKKVEIINELEGNRTEYISHQIEKEEKVAKFSVEILKNSVLSSVHNFITYSTEHVSLGVDVKDFEGMELMQQDPKKPRLFRDFPLIGSEKFYFPFVLNGHMFNPTEDRDGILLHGKDSAEALKNREIMDNAYASAIEFTNWLIQKGAKNRFITALSRIPTEHKWTELSEIWIKENIINYRKFIFSSKLVETENPGEITTIEDSVLPNFQGNQESKLEFYELVKFFKTTSKVPSKKTVLNWIEHVGPSSEGELWPRKIYFDLEDLLREVAELESVENLSKQVGIDEENTFQWINSLVKFLVEKKESELLNEFAIIPNHHGDFEFLSRLYLEEDKDPIDDLFLDVIDSLGEDWRKEIIHRKIKFEHINISKRGLSNLSEKVNEVLKEKVNLVNNTFRWKFKSRTDALQKLVQIISITGKESKEDNFKNQVFLFAKELFGFQESIRVVEFHKSFRFDFALRLLIEMINSRIQELENLEQLAIHLNIPLIKSQYWINEYIILLKAKTEFESLLKFGEIIPNRYGFFCNIESLKNFGTQENPLSDKLLDILFELDEDEDWRIEIVHECISIQMAETLKFEELGNRIQELVSQLQKEDLSDPSLGHLEKYRNCLLDLIEWVHKDDRGERFLKSFKEKSNELFYKLTMRNSNLTVDDIKMLADPDNKELLRQISNSTISKKEIMDLISMAEMLGSASQLLQYADDLVSEKQDMDWLLKVGSEVELAFMKALKNESLRGELIHTGSGSFDFKITNNKNGKVFYIELKSFAYGSLKPLRFAPSQADRAINSKGDFAICLIERPQTNAITIDYIKGNTKAIIKGFNIFISGYNDFLMYKKIIGREENFDSKLRLILLEKERIEIQKSKLLKQADSFHEMIQTITRQIS
jgi:hypothetical protein